MNGSFPRPATANHALQRTASRVTVAASCPPPSPPAAQLPRRAPQSLSLGSFVRRLAHMNAQMSTAKRFGAIFGLLLVSALLIVVFGGAVTYTEVDHRDGTTTVEGAFVSFAPASSHPALSILDLVGYTLGLGPSAGSLLAWGAVGLSLVAGTVLVATSGVQRSAPATIRSVAVAAYCATPILAAVVVFMILYAVIIRSPTVA